MNHEFRALMDTRPEKQTDDELVYTVHFGVEKMLIMRLAVEVQVHQALAADGLPNNYEEVLQLFLEHAVGGDARIAEEQRLLQAREQQRRRQCPIH